MFTSRPGTATTDRRGLRPQQPLPLDKTVTVELTPKVSGEIKYACGMGHITGVLFV